MILKYKKLIKNPQKRELLVGSIETIFIKVAGIVVGLAFTMYISRSFGAEAIGTYQIAIQFATMMAAVSLLGFNQAIIRFSAELISKKHVDQLKWVIKKFSFIAFFMSLILAINIFIFSENLALHLLKDEGQVLVFKVLAIIFPFLTLNTLYVELIRGLKKIKTSELLRTFCIRFLNLVGLLLIIWFAEFNNYIPVITYGFAVVLTFFFSLYFAYKYVKKEEPINVIETSRKHRKYLSTSLVMYQSILLMMLSNQGLIFILAYYAGPTEVGIYNVAFQIATLSIFVFGAITTITAPKYSELYHGSKDTFKETVRFSSKLVFWTSGTLSIITILLSSWFMSLFGEEFLVGSNILIILSTANLVNAFTGSSGVLLDMVGKQHVRRNIIIINTTITLVLASILIPSMGATGLACSMLISVAIGNFSGAYYVYKNLGLNMIYLPFITK